MSKFVATKVGVFRHWKSDSGERGFLYLCPSCEEWLPVNDSILSGEKPIDHEFKREARFCSFGGLHPELGPALVSTMQALVLMEEHPYLPLESQAIEEWHLLAENR
jgi:hypothetical protein